MPWQATIHPDLPIIETCYSGILSSSDLAAAAHETLNLAKTHAMTRLLGDCTQLAGGHSIVDLYLLADAVAVSGLAYTLKEAILLPSLEASSENVKFWETTCFNRGIRVRIFTERQLALNWLIME
jgi:hypothetical protein